MFPKEFFDLIVFTKEFFDLIVFTKEFFDLIVFTKEFFESKKITDPQKVLKCDCIYNIDMLF